MNKSYFSSSIREWLKVSGTRYYDDKATDGTVCLPGSALLIYRLTPSLGLGISGLPYFLRACVRQSSMGKHQWANPPEIQLS